MAAPGSRWRFAMLVLMVALAWGSLAGPRGSAAADLESPAGAAACTPLAESDAAEGLIPIQSLAQGNVYDHGPPRSILAVSVKPDSIVSVIDPAEAPTVASVDLSTNVLVALFIGRWPQEGHRVTIQSARVFDTGVCLTAQVVRPTPGQDAADAETYPYHVVALPVDGLPQAPGTVWTVVSTDGAQVATTTFP